MTATQNLSFVRADIAVVPDFLSAYFGFAGWSSMSGESLSAGMSAPYQIYFFVVVKTNRILMWAPDFGRTDKVELPGREALYQEQYDGWEATGIWAGLKSKVALAAA